MEFFDKLFGNHKEDKNSLKSMDKSLLDTPNPDDVIPEDKAEAKKLSSETEKCEEVEKEEMPINENGTSEDAIEIMPIAGDAETEQGLIRKNSDSEISDDVFPVEELHDSDVEPVDSAIMQDAPVEDVFGTEDVIKVSVEKKIKDVYMPNPMCEVEYHFSLADSVADDVLGVVCLDEIGDLAYEKESHSIVGTPHVSRDFEIRLETADIIYVLKSFINQNPRLMWPDIPSDQKVKLDKDWKGFSSPNTQVLAASHRGRSHAKKGSYRDDDFYIAEEDCFMVSVVADGAGSACFSNIGSKVFCQSAGRSICNLLHEKSDELRNVLHNSIVASDRIIQSKSILRILYGIFPVAAREGRQEIERVAKENNNELKLYQTTALLSFSVKLSDDIFFCASFQVGDGMTAAVTKDKVFLLAEPDKGNFPGETVFVTSGGVFSDAQMLLNRIRYCVCYSTPCIVSMTDGVTDSYFKENPLMDDLSFWHALLKDVHDDNGELKSPEEVCDWLNYYVAQEHDDRTITIVKYL